jgi:hypothetical protein
MRLHPETEILEFQVLTKISVFFVPYLPAVQCPLMEAGHSWRYWVFLQFHKTLAGGAHRAQGPTISMVKRAAWWPELSMDVETWWLACPACAANRGKALKGPARQMRLDDEEGCGAGEPTPWSHVVVDVEGPFAPASEDGARYVLTYRCKAIRASLLAPLTRLSRPRFARAFLDCMFRSRRVPRKVYSDRGPEVRNVMMTELFAILGIEKREGLPRQPIYQGTVERDHLETKLTLTLVLEDLTRSFPTEWEHMLPAVEYLKYVTPYGAGSDLCPRDLDHGWSFAADMEKDLIPFSVAGGECESEFAAALFVNYFTTGMRRL